MQGCHLMQPSTVSPVVQLGNQVEGCSFPPNTSTEESQGIDVVPRTRTGLSGLGLGTCTPVKGTWEGFSPTSMCSFRLADGPLRPLSHGICPSLCISPWTDKGLGYLRTNFVNSLQLLTLLAVGRTPSGHRPDHW